VRQTRIGAEIAPAQNCGRAVCLRLRNEITPERLGLCGAYNWLDGKAAYEIDETGPNKPISKGECLDPVRGVWKGVNDYVYPNSHKTIDSFSAYSIMDHPMTSCGCFEAICAYVPECNGIMVVHREFLEDTPVGMTFSTLAGSVGGGQQTPGFMGCGKVFLTSRKFLFARQPPSPHLDTKTQTCSPGPQALPGTGRPGPLRQDRRRDYRHRSQVSAPLWRRSSTRLPYPI
jgi:hypothetical protein